MRDIKVLHLEPTNVCQAKCPLCARETDSTFNSSNKHHLSMSKITKVFGAHQIATLDKMFMCGNYGDPAAGRNTLDIFKEFRIINPTITLGMNTNGALRTPPWWHNLGSMFNKPHDYVVFSIDGLADTNSIYRVGVNWNRLMKNVQSFITAGGSAHWDMLVYKHNQHQVAECQALAKEMGFTWFRAKISKRGFTDKLQQPVNWSLPNIKSTSISCHALNEKSIYIDAQGTLYPCCWLGNARYESELNFNSIQESWHTNQPNSVCVKTCGSILDKTSFTNQWQVEVQLT